MYAIRKCEWKHDVRVLKQSFLDINITISEADLKSLYEYQRRVCRQLDWVETDPQKMQELLAPLIASGNLYQGTFIMIIKEVIRTYYLIRSRFDYRTADDDIIHLLNQQFFKGYLPNEDTLAERMEKMILKEGGIHYQERVDLY